MLLGEDVPVYAYGPGAHLIKGTMEQCFIGYVISYAGCLGPAAAFNEECKISSGGRQSVISWTLLTTSVFAYFYVR